MMGLGLTKIKIEYNLIQTSCNHTGGFFSNLAALVGAEKINFMERGRLFIWSKRVFIILGAFLLQACSGDDTPTPEEKPVELQKPVAKDDTYETGEN